MGGAKTPEPVSFSAGVIRIADAMENHVGELADEILEILCREVPVFGAMTSEARDQLRPVMTAELRSGIERIRSRTRLMPLAARESYREQGEAFAEQGLALEGLTRTFEVATRVVVPRVVEEAIKLGGGEAFEALGYYLQHAMDQLTDGVSIICRAYLDRAAELEQSRRLLRDEFLTDLVTGADPVGLEVRATALGFPRADRFGALVVPVPVDAARATRAALDSIVAHATPGPWRLGIGHVIAVVVPETSSCSSLQRSVAKRLASTLKERGIGQVIVALGQPQPGLEGVKASFDEALEVCRVAQAWRRHGVSDAHDVALERLLFRTPRAAAELRELIAPLEAYDAEFQGALIQTLRAFIEAGMSSARASAALGVHRNTLRYRLDTISRLIDGDLRDQRLALKLALLARQGDA